MALILRITRSQLIPLSTRSDAAELERMLRPLSWLGVRGHTISPGYGYDAAKEDMRKGSTFSRKISS